ncbi:hypothetical protein [Serratia sp. CY43514]|uniref:hypothetical protein n=1 Tax=Serratia sp. CY43514 TaxID=3383620 RepID=UPI0040258E41
MPRKSAFYIGLYKSSALESIQKQDAVSCRASQGKLSKLPMDAFEQGEKLAEQYANKNSQGSVQGTYYTLDCLSLQNASEAETIFERYSK